MKCHSQESIPRVGGKGNQDRVSIPCGKCPACLHNRREDWAFRLEAELENSKSAIFLTLTYSDENVKKVSKTEIQTFIRELRRTQKQKLTHSASKYRPNTDDILKWPSIRYYAVSEYGEKTGRPHYHLIMFNVTTQAKEAISQIWNKGFVHFGKVSQASIRYTLKYLMKDKSKDKNFTLMSRMPGIGHSYIKKNFKWHRETKNAFALNPGGKKVKLPRYMKERLFSQKERLLETSKIISIQDSEEIKENERIKKLGNDPHYYDILRKEKFAQLLKEKRNKNYLI